jgi:hypothetical protein
MALNNSNQIIPTWMSDSWQMATVDPSTLASHVTDSVVFHLANPSHITVLFHGSNSNSSTFWGSLDSSSVTAAALSTAAKTTVKGVTSSGQPFHIDHTDGLLTCTLDNFALQTPWHAVALGVIAGTLLGAVGGLAARSSVLGALAGLIGATTGSLIVARAGALNKVLDGSTPTWVANDGQHPVGKPRPGQGDQGQGTDSPHSLKVVSA